MYLQSVKLVPKAITSLSDPQESQKEKRKKKQWREGLAVLLSCPQRRAEESDRVEKWVGLHYIIPLKYRKYKYQTFFPPPTLCHNPVEHFQHFTHSNGRETFPVECQCKSVHANYSARFI